MHIRIAFRNRLGNPVLNLYSKVLWIYLSRFSYAPHIFNVIATEGQRLTKTTNENDTLNEDTHPDHSNIPITALLYNFQRKHCTHILSKHHNGHSSCDVMHAEPSILDGSVMTDLKWMHNAGKFQNLMAGCGCDYSNSFQDPQRMTFLLKYLPTNAFLRLSFSLSLQSYAHFFSTQLAISYGAFWSLQPSTHSGKTTLKHAVYYRMKGDKRHIYTCMGVKGTSWAAIPGVTTIGGAPSAVLECSCVIAPVGNRNQSLWVTRKECKEGLNCSLREDQWSRPLGHNDAWYFMANAPCSNEAMQWNILSYACACGTAK